MTSLTDARCTRMRRRLLLLPALAALGLPLLAGAATPAAAHGDRARIERLAGTGTGTDAPVQSDNLAHLTNVPGQIGISACFLTTAPVMVTSGVDSVKVFDVSDPADPRLTGTLASAQFENEAMSCGERRTKQGIVRFALIGVDSVQVSPGQIDHVNVGGGELIVVDVTDPTAPFIRSRTPGTTSTHTVTCVAETDCKAAYSAGGRTDFSIFDLRDLDHPGEVDAKPGKAGTQPFASPTGGHKWNVDAAGYATHTGWNGASMWDVSRIFHPRLVTTTGRAGQGTAKRYPGWNDFIEHNSVRPAARRFKPDSRPSLKHGNILLTTEEDYEQTDCAKAGSFQTWWVKRLDGSPHAIKPLDKVELADLGSFPLPRGAFCSSHWFDVRHGLVAVGFYGGGTQILDVRHPKHIKAYGHAVWGASEVWDNLWVPEYDARGHQTGRDTNVVYAIDLVRGLDVYAVDVPGDGRGAVPPPATSGESRADLSGGVLPVGLVLSAGLGVLVLRRRHGGVIRHG